MSGVIGKSGLVVAVALLIAMESSAQGVKIDERDKGWDKRDLTVYVSKDSSEWWMKSWEKGMRYVGKSTYNFEGTVDVTAPEKGKFLDKVANHMRVGATARFEGVAQATTFCFDTAPNLCLMRRYELVDNKRFLGGQMRIKDLEPYADRITAVVSKTVNWVKKALDGTPPEIKAGLIARYPELAPVLLLSYSVSHADIEQRTGLKFLGDGVEISKDNLIFATLLPTERLESLYNIAASLQEDFDKKTFLISARGSLSGSRRYRELDIEAGQKQTEIMGWENFGKFSAAMKECQPKVRSILDRESFVLASEIWDYSVRKPGDVWMVNAKFMDSFLHPDLKGAFSGQVLVRYKADRDYASNDDSPMCKVRVLEIIETAEFDGRKQRTDFKYDESKSGEVNRFTATYNPEKSSGEIYIDCTNNAVLYGKFYFDADAVETLPNIPFSAGLKGDGNGRLRIEYRGSVFSIEEK